MELLSCPCRAVSRGFPPAFPLSLDVTVHTSVCLRSGQPGTGAWGHGQEEQPVWALPWGFCFCHLRSHPLQFSFWSRSAFIRFRSKRFVDDLRDNSCGSCLLTVKIALVWHFSVSQLELDQAEELAFGLGHKGSSCHVPGLNLKDTFPWARCAAEEQSLSGCLSSQQCSPSQGCREGPTAASPRSRVSPSLAKHPTAKTPFPSRLELSLKRKPAWDLPITVCHQSLLPLLLSVRKLFLCPYELSSNRNFHIYYPSIHSKAVDVLAINVFQMWLFCAYRVRFFTKSHNLCALWLETEAIRKTLKIKVISRQLHRFLIKRYLKIAVWFLLFGKLPFGQNSFT